MELNALHEYPHRDMPDPDLTYLPLLSGGAYAAEYYGETYHMEREEAGISLVHDYYTWWKWVTHGLLGADTINPSEVIIRWLMPRFENRLPWWE